jgi:hypothetical protein
MSKSKKRSHTKRRQTKRRHNKRSQTKKRHLYRKRREIRIIPGSKSVPLFSKPEKKTNTPIFNNFTDKRHINMIPGLRNYLKNQM